MRITVLIMAGGKGERFWPKGRRALPKQFLKLTNSDKTMLQLTWERIRELAGPEDIFVISNEAYGGLVKEQLLDIPDANVICEPEGRDTAPCIGLGAMYVRKRYPDEDAVMIVLPADHLIKDNAAFAGTLRKAADAAQESSGLITLGIRPSYPETGYGYIKYGDEKIGEDVFKVEAFKEKPDEATAKEYLKNGDHLWNSGMFIWKLSAIEEAFEKYLPQVAGVLNGIRQDIGTAHEKDTLRSDFAKAQKISVDYGIMEKADNIFTIPGEFGWDDVGSWNAMDRVYKPDDHGNVITGNSLARDTKRSIMVNDTDKLLCVMGMDDIVAVNTDDAILVCPKSRTGEIKELIKDIEAKGFEKYL